MLSSLWTANNVVLVYYVWYDEIDIFKNVSATAFFNLFSLSQCACYSNKKKYLYPSGYFIGFTFFENVVLLVIASHLC